jgi:hypothetical protein
VVIHGRRPGIEPGASSPFPAGLNARPTWLYAVSLVSCFLLLSCRGSASAPTATSRPSSTARTSTGPTGPNATLDPRMGPPGIQVSVSGSGWPAGASVVITGETVEGQAAKPYATVTATTGGTISAAFRLEKTAGGDDLKVGPYQLILRAGATQLEVSFQVQTARPVAVPGGG